MNLIGLDFSKHVDMDGKKIFISGVEQKGKTAFAIEMTHRVHRTLEAIRKQPRPKGQTRVFLVTDRVGEVRPLTLSMFRDEWDRVRTATKMLDKVPHDMRHTFASRLAEAGYTAEQIAPLMGQRSAESARRYIKFDRKRLGGLTKALNKFGK